MNNKYGKPVTLYDQKPVRNLRPIRQIMTKLSKYGESPRLVLTSAKQRIGEK